VNIILPVAGKDIPVSRKDAKKLYLVLKEIFEEK